MPAPLRILWYVMRATVISHERIEYARITCRVSQPLVRVKDMVATGFPLSPIDIRHEIDGFVDILDQNTGKARAEFCNGCDSNAKASGHGQTSNV